MLRHRVGAICRLQARGASERHAAHPCKREGSCRDALCQGPCAPILQRQREGQIRAGGAWGQRGSIRAMGKRCQEEARVPKGSIIIPKATCGLNIKTEASVMGRETVGLCLHFSNQPQISMACLQSIHSTPMCFGTWVENCWSKLSMPVLVVVRIGGGHQYMVLPNQVQKGHN